MGRSQADIEDRFDPQDDLNLYNGAFAKKLAASVLKGDVPIVKQIARAEGIDNLITLSDHKTLVFSTKYGFLIEELRLRARGVIVVDKDNVVRYVEYVKEVTTEPDYESAVNAAKQYI